MPNDPTTFFGIFDPLYRIFSCIYSSFGRSYNSVRDCYITKWERLSWKIRHHLIIWFVIFSVGQRCYFLLLPSCVNSAAVGARQRSSWVTWDNFNPPKWHNKIFRARQSLCEWEREKERKRCLFYRCSASQQNRVNFKHRLHGQINLSTKACRYLFLMQDYIPTLLIINLWIALWMQSYSQIY